MKNLRHNHIKPDAERDDATINISLRNSFLTYALAAGAMLVGAGYLATQMPVPDDGPQYVQPAPAVVAQPAKRIDRASLAEAEAAKRATYDRAIEMRSGYCSRAVRQVVQKSQGSTKYAYLFGDSAKDSANLFLKYGYGVLWPSQKARLGGKIQPGDILFKRYVAKNSRGTYFGHVGIYAGNDLVWENSSTSIGRLSGAKGYRSLTQFGFYNGSVDVIGRLPAPAVSILAKRAVKK